MSRAILLACADEERRKKELKISRRAMRDASNPLSLPCSEFVSNFRLSKDAFDEVCREVIPKLPPTQRCTAIRDELKVLAALSFYSHGSYQRGVGASYLHNMSQPALSNCLEEVTVALNSPEILKKYINFPSQRERRETVMTDFMDKHGFPGIIGCIDGTHVAIVRPVEHEECYFNRKGYHSLNVLVICDSHLTIEYIDASFGGAAHDSFIWTQSPIKTFMEGLNLGGERCWLLGDSGFPQRNYLMTPILRATEGTPEELYTKLHCSTRNVVERCFGVLKARWRCLLAHRVLHYSPRKAGKIVNACAVLHNIANAHNVPVPHLNDADREVLRQSQEDVTIANNNYSDARTVLVRRLWTSRQ